MLVVTSQLDLGMIDLKEDQMALLRKVDADTAKSLLSEPYSTKNLHNDHAEIIESLSGGGYTPVTAGSLVLTTGDKILIVSDNDFGLIKLT